MNKFTRLAGLDTDDDVWVGAGAKLLRLVDVDTECEAVLVRSVTVDAVEDVLAASPKQATSRARTTKWTRPSDFQEAILQDCSSWGGPWRVEPAFIVHSTVRRTAR